MQYVMLIALWAGAFLMPEIGALDRVDVQIDLKSPLTFQRKDYLIKVSIKRQKLTLYRGQTALKSYLISTSVKGAGERLHSLKTPRGLHRIDAKIGNGAPLYTIFKARKSQGIRWTAKKGPRDDLILSRILTLEGLESGLNRGTDAFDQCIDTKQRHIYIHGTHQEERIGEPASHGCIRMKNRDIADLFELVPIGSLVLIE